MQTQKIFTSVLAFFFVSISLISSVSAQTGSTTTMLQQRKQGDVTARCERITARVNARIENYETNKARHIERYTAIHKRVTKLIQLLDEKGYDTKELKSDLQELKEKQDEFLQKYKEFIDILKEAQTSACGGSEGQFKEQIQIARENLKQAREQAREIRKLIRDEIRQDLLDIKSQKPAQD